MKPRWRRWPWAVSLGALGLAACTTAPVYAFRGRPYDAAKKCVRDVTTIDVMSGTDPGSCPPRCVTRTASDGGFTLLVTDTCGPPPLFYSEDTSALCSEAIPIFSTTSCARDGG